METEGLTAYSCPNRIERTGEYVDCNGQWRRDVLPIDSHSGCFVVHFTRPDSGGSCHGRLCNGDGKPDVALITYFRTFNSQSSELYILQGKGDGTLQLVNQYAVPGQASSLVTGDFDGDGRQDIAVGNSVGNFGSTGVAIYYGQGNGSFKPVYPFAAPVAVLVAGDFNGDGRADLIAADGGKMDVFFGLTPLIPTTVTLAASPEFFHLLSNGYS